MLLSILVPTLEVRRRSFDAVSRRLQTQIEDYRLAEYAELLFLRHPGPQTAGAMRNQLLSMATGEFVVFVEDQDEVSPQYAVRLCQALQNRPETDCLGIRGCISFRGQHSMEFVHSLRYSDQLIEQGVYYRPPYPLNPMRRSVAAAFRFDESPNAEEIDWARRLQREGALRSEVFIDDVLYHCRSRRSWQHQRFLESTKGIRTTLRRQLANRPTLTPVVNLARSLRLAVGGSGFRDGK